MKNRDKIIKLLIVFSGTMQLVFSQKHIETITKVFYGGIGIYLFAFILLGAVCIFNLGNLESEGKPKQLILCNIITMIFGLIYAFLLYSDVINNTKLTFDTIMFSFILTLGSVIMLGTGSVLTLVKK